MVDPGELGRGAARRKWCYHFACLAQSTSTSKTIPWRSLTVLGNDDAMASGRGLENQDGLLAAGGDLQGH